MESLFFVGQRVVATADHSAGDFLKGQEFTVLAIKPIHCSVGIRIFDYEKGFNYKMVCSCGFQTPARDGFYFDQTVFAPVQEMGSMTYEDAIAYVQPKALQL